MSEALYRKYRPNTFDDVVGQEHIERTLKNALEQEKVSHAYLFCGPRGTGKTTMARILAKALLCEKGPTTEPDGDCEECLEIAGGTHPDVYELDAASRTGVENVREEIINRVHYAPTRGSYKIYIIDEVHMLSTAAFNALLKTLEEPPAHVVFILCTTDPQKVPDTILSRCQRFDFHRLSVDEIVARLGAVCVQEDVEFDAEALELIAHQAEGGMRNALTSLEQLAAFGEGRVTLDGAHRILGSLDNEDLSEFVQALGKRDAAMCFTWVSDYLETGADIAQFVQDIAEYFRNLYLMSLTDADVEIAVSTSTRASMERQLELFGAERLSRALGVLGDLMKELRATSNSRLTFEIALTRLLRPESDLTIEALAERLEDLEMKMLSRPQAIASVSAFDPSIPTPAEQIGSTPDAFDRHSPASTTLTDTHPIPAPQAAPTPNPHPAPQQMPAPVPQPSVASVSSGIAVAPSATERTQPSDSQMGGVTISAQSAAAVPVQPTVSESAQRASAVLDYGNPAALQRMWSAVTASLRKSNPARGVLFMGAKVEPNVQNDGLSIVFSPDSSFAYSAAQRKEVRDLLAQTFLEVAGGTVPFELVLGGEHGRADVPQARVQSVEEAQTHASQPQAPAPQVQPQPTQATREAQASAPQLQSMSDISVQSPVPSSNSSEAPSTQVPVVPEVASSYSPSTPRYADESPFCDDDIADIPTQPALNDQGIPHSPEPISQPVSQTAHSGMPQDFSLQQPAPSETTSTQPVAPASPSSAEGELSESDQIKEILTGAFGDSVKFDTI